MRATDDWLKILESSLADVRFRGSSQSIHALRVATGRLSVWLELAGRRALRDDLGWLRQLAGEVRDLDVAADTTKSLELEAPYSARGSPEARAVERRRALEALRRSLSVARVDDVLLALRLVPGLNQRSARRAVERLEWRVLAAGARLDEARVDPALLHRLRRRVRRLRYALEWLGRDSRPLVELQDALGEVQDLQVSSLWLPRGPEDAVDALEHLTSDLEHARVRALTLWDSLEPRLAEMCSWNSA